MTLSRTLWFAAWGCLVLALISVLVLGQVWHFSYYDIGIYGEALHRLRGWSDLNPFIPGRGIRIFNDHFDPILILVAPLANLAPAPLVGILVDFLCVGLAWFPIRMLHRHGLLTMEGAYWVFTVWVLNHACQNALTWPFHPTTWGNLPLFYLFAYVLIDRPRAAIVSFLVASITREEFPLIGLPLTLIFWTRKQRGPAFATLTATTTMLVFQYVIKPHVIAGVHAQYGKILLQGLMSDPFGHLWDMMSLSFVRMSLERYWPLVLILILALRESRERFWSWGPKQKAAVTALVLGSSILGIRYASYQWAFHYGPAALIVLIFAVIPFLRNYSFKSRWVTASLVILIGFSLSLSGRLINTAIRKNGDRSRLLSDAWKQIEALPVQKMLASNNLAANVRWVSDKVVDIYILGGLDTPNAGPFELVWVEKPPGGDAWRVGHERIDAMIKEWRANPKLEILRDDAASFIARGVIENDR